jgi:hypothetical protein
MQVRWQQLMVKLTVWMAAEVILNLVGTDSLADYSEFLYRSYGGDSAIQRCVKG